MYFFLPPTDSHEDNASIDVQASNRTRATHIHMNQVLTKGTKGQDRQGKQDIIGIFPNDTRCPVLRMNYVHSNNCGFFTTIEGTAHEELA